ncbi:MAG: dihydropteroate synthase [Rhodobacterales bacterium]|nr:MAG: dihydropteroate synthase [Rhodobacterales bacterium]
MTPLRPLLRAVPGGNRLAGQDLWFSEVAQGAEVLSDLSNRDLSPFITPRAPICGLPMDRPHVMGILNVTPDSFSDGGSFDAPDAALTRARALAEVCDMIDIGGESTRPGAHEVPVDEEIARTAPVIAAIRAAGITTPISIDTRKAKVAEAALNAGADLINDVAAFEFDPEMADLAAERGAPVCIMHAQGLPEHMQDNPRYGDVVSEVYRYLEARIAFCEDKGIARSAILVDPGIGFGKTVTHCLELMRDLAVFHGLGVGVLLGASRKSFIGAVANEPDPQARMPGSLAAALWGASQGMQMIRVHDAAQTAQALRLWRAMERGEP